MRKSACGAPTASDGGDDAASTAAAGGVAAEEADNMSKKESDASQVFVHGTEHLRGLERFGQVIAGTLAHAPKSVALLRF